MPINTDKILNDIFEVSEKIYRDISNPSERDHSQIFEHLTTLGRVLVGADRASFWKWDRVNHTLWTTAATGAGKITIPDTTGLVGKALHDQKVVITNDPYNDPNFNSSVDKKTGYVTRSILVMPVSNVNGDFIGAFQVINKLIDDQKFHEEDCKKLALAATICGLALESDVFLEESHTDKLTLLRNRMGFFHDFKQKYKTVMEDSARSMALFICDIDKFKRVNDTYGHNIGDEVLKQAADILKKNCRECDGVYRWGGEEFIMIMTDADASVCANVAERIRKVIEDTDYVGEECTVHYTMSFGVSDFYTYKSIEDNINDADQKLYTAKETGRNKVVI